MYDFNVRGRVGRGSYGRPRLRGSFETGYCETPGMKIRSGGSGRGLARGGGRGPVGIPAGFESGRLSRGVTGNIGGNNYPLLDKWKSYLRSGLKV